MSFLKRLYYFTTGLIIGIFFLFFILNGKKTSCNYGPNARVIDNIISKEIVLKNNRDTLSNDSLIDLLSKGRVRFNKSKPNKNPCGIYFIESGSKILLVENCEEKASVEFK
tara:strand:- start:1172 stop:1504 length:333 start_codon:yes stop_codon:yes gene_type:complete